jgi:DNA-binding PadR family transcriptional regulator
MLELAILGFLAEGPLHGYELRRRVAHLSGFARPVSDGSLYPALDRMVRKGWLERRAERGKAAGQKQVLHLTESGRNELLARIREPADVDITDFSRFAVILAFLSHLSDVGERDAVLKRRLAFLEEPGSFFYDGDRPLRERDMSDPYRKGLFVIARATSTTERAWLRRVLDHD